MNGKILRAVWWVLFALVLLVVAAIRIRLLGIPLERDEGEYGYAGQLMLQGIPPYQLAYNMKFPGTYAAYAVVMSIFGQTIIGIHLGLLIVNLASVVLIFLIGRRLLGEIGAIAAATSYAILSVTPYVLGLAAHATHFVVLPVLAAALLLLVALERPSLTRFFFSGILFGIGVLMKQPGFFLALFGLALLLFHKLRARSQFKDILISASTFSVGVALPLAVTCLVLWWTGVFGKFWFWTIDYARQYGGLIKLSEAPPIFFARTAEVIGTTWVLWILAAIGVVSCLVMKKARVSGGASFILGLLVFSLLALAPGFFFRSHYFILVLPALALLIGAAIAGATISLERWAMLRFVLPLICASALAFPIFSEREYFFQRSPVGACRMAYGTNPFPESFEIAKYIRERTEPADAIAVIGSEPQIYFYAQRPSATGYIYTYPLMEPQKFARQMQTEMIEEIERARPKYLVLVIVNKSWLAGPDSDVSIFKWANKYCDEFYDEAAVVNISEQGSEFFSSGVPRTSGLAPDHVFIYRRKL